MVLRFSVGAVLVMIGAIGCVRPQPAAAPTVVVINDVGRSELAISADPPDYGGTWVEKDEVDVEWHGSWWPAIILEKHHGHWLVHYEGYADDWDELVAGDRIRERRAEPPVVIEPETDSDTDP